MTRCKFTDLQVDTINVANFFFLHLAPLLGISGRSPRPFVAQPRRLVRCSDMSGVGGATESRLRSLELT